MQETQNSHSVVEGSGQSGRILVVEDEKGIRETVRFALELEGFEVFTAANGKEGLDMLREIPRPCLILLDLMMPVMDGWGFVDAVEQDKALAKIPVVVVSAFADKAKSVGAKEMLGKPVDLDELCETAKRWCG